MNKTERAALRATTKSIYRRFAGVKENSPPTAQKLRNSAFQIIYEYLSNVGAMNDEEITEYIGQIEEELMEVKSIGFVDVRTGR